MSENDAAQSIARASAKSNGLPLVVQPRGEHFVHVVKTIDINSEQIVETIAKRPDVAASPSPYRMCYNESMEAQGSINENTPLRNGPGPLQMDSPGLSPIVHHNAKSFKGKATNIGGGMGMKGEGIAYRRTPLKDVGNTKNSIPSHSQQQHIFTPEKGYDECDEKLLSMHMLDETTSPPGKEARRDSINSSLETMSMLIDQSMRTPLRGRTSKSQAREAESPQALSLLDAGEHHVEADKKKHDATPLGPSASSGKMVLFGVDLDHQGTPVIVPFKGEREGGGSGGRGGVPEGDQLFTDSAQPASLPTSHTPPARYLDGVSTHTA